MWFQLTAVDTLSRGSLAQLLVDRYFEVTPRSGVNMLAPTQVSSVLTEWLMIPGLQWMTAFGSNDQESQTTMQCSAIATGNKSTKYTYCEVIATNVMCRVGKDPLTCYDKEHGYITIPSVSPATLCHGPECSRSRRVTGSYGRSTSIEDLVDTIREHGHSAVSMETMDSYRLTCKGGPSHMQGGPGTATRRTKLKEQAQPQRGPSSRSMQMVTTQGLKRQESKEPSLVKGEGAVYRELASRS
ncbi:uncharacterized protein UHOR_14149 [Ustilago hordei]|uniref:Uncharacterized protein n=1 Tax=Ustilago hordei TaxID=120017 RepID=I2FSX0_USTHO|nr:uncharacterized protein UHOR_14149 [Ustilago hordei]